MVRAHGEALSIEALNDMRALQNCMTGATPPARHPPLALTGGDRRCHLARECVYVQLGVHCAAGP